MAQLLAAFGAHFTPAQTAAIVASLGDRVRNEMMRLVTVKAFIVLARSAGGHVDLAPVTPQLVRLCTDFLRKNQRALKLATLGLLHALLANEACAKAITADVVMARAATNKSTAASSDLLDNLAAQISDADLQLATLAVQVVNELLRTVPPPPNVTAAVLWLCHSPTLQSGAGFAAVTAYWRAVAMAQVRSLVAALTLFV